MCLHQVDEDLHRVAEWCCANRVLINPEKTKLILFGVSQLQLRVPSNISIAFLGQQLTPVTSVEDLGVILDCNLSFNDHISSLTSSLSSALCQINRVRHSFSKGVLSNILNSLVFSKLFYCSTVWSATSKENIQKLQLMQNFAARILTNTRKFDEISPVLNDLGWLSIDKLLCLRDVIMVYKCIHKLTPTYLSSLLVSRSTIHTHNTRNRDNISLPMCCLAAAQRNFTYRAVKMWNALSSLTRNSETVGIFKRRAKREIALM